jgi:hypothetical protein
MKLDQPHLNVEPHCTLLRLLVPVDFTPASLSLDGERGDDRQVRQRRNVLA